MKTRQRKNFYSTTILTIAVSLLVTLPATAQRIHWERSGLDNDIVTCMGANETMLFAGTQGEGLFRSTDRGVSWTSLDSSHGLAHEDWFRKVITLGTTIYAASANNGVFKSTDNGDNWVFAGTEVLIRRDVMSLVSIGTGLYAGGGGGAVYRSTDGGDSWMDIDHFTINSAVTGIANIDSVLFAATEEQGIFRSTDFGTSWQQANVGLTTHTLDDLVVNGRTLFTVAFNGGVFRSTDLGDSWSTVDTGNVFHDAISLFVTHGVIFLGLNANYGAYTSSDDGQSWTPTDSLPVTVEGFALQDSVLFAGGGEGVYKANISFLGVPQTKQAAVRNTISPNPASSTIRISGDGGEILDVRIYDLLGRQILDVSRPNSMIDIKGIPVGSYVVRIKSMTGFVTLPLLVVR